MLPRPDVVALLSDATVFACPSIYEPLGIVNLEAMACETAVVATATGGIPEVVVDGETGRLVPIEQATDGTGTPLDPDQYVADFAAALNEVVSDPDRAARDGPGRPAARHRRLQLGRDRRADAGDLPRRDRRLRTAARPARSPVTMPGLETLTSSLSTSARDPRLGRLQTRCRRGRRSGSRLSPTSLVMYTIELRVVVDDVAVVDHVGRRRRRRRSGRLGLASTRAITRPGLRSARSTGAVSTSSRPSGRRAGRRRRSR